MSDIALPTGHNYTKEYIRKVAGASTADPRTYDLKHCISQHSKPRFGLPDMDFGRESDFNIHAQTDAVFKSIVAFERENHVYKHVMKCFTYGKEIRREAASNGNKY